MEFTPANAWQEFKTASHTEQGTLDDSGNEVVLGPRLNEAVRHLANGYLKRLELGPANKATDERAKILDLHWGRVEHDGARLRGLGAAMTNLAETLGANVTKLAEGWQGESYDAFKSAMDKVARTMSEYGAAATTTGDGLVGAMAQTRTLYQTFAEAGVNSHLNFGDMSPPEKWHKITDHDKYSGFELAEVCPTWHSDTFDCLKNNDEQRNMITDHFVTELRWENCKQDGCEESLDRVSIMYTNLTEQCDAAVKRIKGKLDTYFDAVDTVVDGVTQLYDVALGNVYTFANAEVFSSLRVIGAPGDQPAEEEASPGPVGVAEPEPSAEPPSAEP
ncbi:MAG: WXG100 family type VII secretion target, partial [Pseudonocardiaceae bacterium]|nr:WXG100 family type VII secretion target [Pseudonocardiaceae bacterium]